MKPSGIGLAVPLGAAPVAVAVRADVGTAVLRALTALVRSRPVGALSALVLVAMVELTIVFAAAEELLVRVMVVVQDELEAAGDEASVTLFSPGTHCE